MDSELVLVDPIKFSPTHFAQKKKKKKKRFTTAILHLFQDITNYTCYSCLCRKKFFKN